MTSRTKRRTHSCRSSRPDPARTERAPRFRPPHFLSPLFARLGLFLLLAGCGGGEAVVEIALHPTKPHLLYVATNDYIFKTRDAGSTWHNVSKGMTHSRVIALAIDPLLPANVYAGTKGDAIFRSFNGGHLWHSQRHNLEDVTMTSVVHGITFVPGSSHHLFATTSLGVFETKDAGVHWTKRMNGMVEVLMVICMDIDPNQPQTLYAGTSGGVYQSLDGAATWAKVNHGLVPPEVLQSSRALNVVKIKIDRHVPGVVYAATLKGLYKTTDGGAVWRRRGTSLPDQFFSGLALDPVTPGVVFVSSRAGVHTSRDGGDTWEAVNDGLTNLNIRAMAISPIESSTLYVGTNRAGLFRTRDGGRLWESVPLSVRSQPSV